MIWAIIGLLILAVFVAPFRVSSAESRREEEEVKHEFGACKTIYPPIYEWDEEAKR